MPIKEKTEYTNKELLFWISETLEAIAKDCTMALEGEWDRSDEGFNAMSKAAQDALELVYVLKGRL
jgi:hypothetical protein